MLAVLAEEERFLIGLADTRTDFNAPLVCRGRPYYIDTAPRFFQVDDIVLFIIIYFFSPHSEMYFQFSPICLGSEWNRRRHRRAWEEKKYFSVIALTRPPLRESTRRGVESALCFAFDSTRRRLTNLITRAEKTTAVGVQDGSARVVTASLST